MGVIGIVFNEQVDNDIKGLGDEEYRIVIFQKRKGCERARIF